MIKQCKFKDMEGNVCGGIYCKFDNGDEYIICACCGGIMDKDDVTDLVIYNHWIDFTEFIIDEVEPTNIGIEMLYDLQKEW